MICSAGFFPASASENKKWPQLKSEWVTIYGAAFLRTTGVTILTKAGEPTMTLHSGPVKHRAITRILFITATAIFGFSANPSLAASDPRIVVVTPAPNTVFRPGDKIRVRVDVDPSVQVSALVVFPDLKSRVLPLELSTPPFEGDLIIPNNITGQFSFDVGVVTVTDERLDGPEVPFKVIPDETPARIGISDPLFTLRLPSTPGGPLPVGDDRTISVRGYYADGVYRNITLSILGTTYTSSDPGIATVSSEGVLTPVSSGVTYIVVDHRGVKAFAQVKVRDADKTELPPTDQTAKVAIAAGGFRLDRATGRYLQSVTVKNTSALPLWFPLNLIVADLPPNVELRGGTKGGGD
jgi:hypothetical protein